MKALTTAQRREAQLNAFNEKYIHDFATAKNLFNRYYRYVAIAEREFYASNDAKVYNTRYYFEIKEKEKRTRERLQADLHKYGISIYVPWTVPFLGIINPVTGGVDVQVIEPILYK